MAAGEGSVLENGNGFIKHLLYGSTGIRCQVPGIRWQGSAGIRSIARRIPFALERQTSKFDVDFLGVLNFDFRDSLLPDTRHLKPDTFL
jgi:hypothetical protein